MGVLLGSVVGAEVDPIVHDLRFDAKTLKNLTLLTYIQQVKADTEEADKACGRKLPRGKNIPQLCRCCETPNELTACCVCPIKLKSQAVIERLVQRSRQPGPNQHKHLEKLQEMSQHAIDLAYHKCRFGTHNKHGVHQATPMEPLHQIYLGMDKITEQQFEAQIGSKSIAFTKVNSLACNIGRGLARQSDRTLPKISHTKGLKLAKLPEKSTRESC